MTSLDASTAVPFRGSHARREGRVTLGALRGPSFVPLYPDTYVGSLALVTLAVRRLALREWLGPDAVVGGALAADAYGAPTVDELVEVVVRPDRRLRHPSVRVRRDALAPGEVCEVDGVLVTSPERTAFDLARRLAVVDGVAMADALGRWHPVTGAGLRDLGWAHPGVRGVRRVFEVARLVRPGAESLPESRLRVGLVLRGVPEPTVQLRVLDRRRVVIARPDLAWREFRLALEYDGEVHLSRERRARDIDRDDRLRAMGWLVLRVMADQMRDLDGVAARALAELRARGWRP
ncbi:DUF559 domain-containing protein [Actinomycetospora endophytica]|uniref:DUF559 domain-containing protein n=1 Tax=Actinomycetospora endophytica TaxID=2291215 RepID=A0ABS8PBD1_9PSEU|nr:DUF559 domain-containing protein [Actinomycetospora endophytica]MCD2195567.1 DUF559 domain-containing protein [Actinomycetospora endophytica]